MVLTLSIIAIIAAIAIGYKWKINAGIVGAAFAFIIAICFGGKTATQVIGYWPDNIVYFVLICGLFFGFAVVNGTVAKLGEKMLYMINGRAALIPWVIFLIGIVIGALGAGVGGIAILGPLCFPLCAAAGISPVMTAVAIISGDVIGINNPFTGQMGIVIRNLISDVANCPENAQGYSMSVFLSRVIIHVLMVAVVYVLTKSYKAKKIEVKKPDPFSPVQHKTMVLLLVATAFMVLSVALDLVFKDVAMLKTLAAFAQPQAIMTICAVIAMFMKLAPTDKVLKSVPLNTAFLLAGFSLLMGVAKDAGLVEALASILSSGIPGWLLKALFCLLAGIMSLFASGTGVVQPLLFVLVVPLAQAIGIDPGLFIVAVCCGTATASSFSPFSTGGALVLAGCPDSETQDKLSMKLIPVAIASAALAAVLCGAGVFDLILIH